MNGTVRILMDGRMIEVPEGITILDAARREGVHIPTLCHSPLLRPLENCRLCVVRVAGESKFKAACSTRIVDGMEITTSDEALSKTRKLLLGLLLDAHYGDCVAPCTLKCPANVDIQGYLALIRQGEYREAVRLIKEKIPMPASIGRVCPRFCESACRRRLVDEPIAINFCKRFVADYEMKTGERVLPPAPPLTGSRVAIIGGGPAGLSAAYYLRGMGHGVTIFESRPKLGGMLRYGIPEYRLPKSVLEWEIDGILSLGVEVKTTVSWGPDFTLTELKNDGFDAVFVAIGAWASRSLGITGEDLQGVVRGTDFLEGIANDVGDGSVEGKRIAVVGGGNVAIDAARSALRLGAQKVSILYRRSRNEMPASHEEVEAAQEEGVDIQFLVAPSNVSGEGGAVNRLHFIRMELGEPDAGGRRRPVPVEGSEKTIPVDLVISAIGQYPSVPWSEMDDWSGSGLPITRWSTIGGDPRSMYSGKERVFVGGDVFRGPATVVAALADGRKAAYSIDRSLRAGKVEPEPLHFNISKGELEAIDRDPFSVVKSVSREKMPEMQTNARLKNFMEVELGLNEEQLQKEAGRCLVCGCSAAFDCRLRESMDEFQLDWRDQPAEKVHYQHVAVADTHPFISLDPNKCIRCERCSVACSTFQCSDAIELKDWPRINDRCVNCGLCVDICPTGALTEKRDGRTIERVNWREVKSHCVHCGLGCEVQLNVKGNKLAWVSNGSESSLTSGSLCRKGRFLTWDPVWFGDRISSPMLRRNGSLEATNWQEAIKFVAEKFQGLQGPAVGAMASPRAANESVYLLQKWMRAAQKSNSLDFVGRPAKENMVRLMTKSGIKGGMQLDIRSLEAAKAIFIFGDGIEETSPVAATVIRRVARNGGALVIQLASVPDDLTPFASVAIHSKARYWSGLVKSLMEGTGASARGDRHEVRLSEAASEVCARIAESSRGWERNISEEGTRAVRQAFSEASSVAFVFSETLALEQQTADLIEGLLTLAMLKRGPRGEIGTGLYPVSTEINALGALLMGASPNYLPGLRGIKEASARDKIEKAWEVKGIPAEEGGSLEESLEAGKVKALYVQDAASLWEKDPEKWKRLFEKVEFLALQESIPSPAMDYAHAVLPSAGYAEQAGTVTNQEGRVLCLERALEPRGESLADWDITARITAASGVPCPRDLAGIQREIAKIVEGSASAASKKKPAKTDKLGGKVMGARKA